MKKKTSHLPLQAFVPFLQNHDQVGNRAMGERISSLAPAEALELAYAALTLSPSIPLFFMGEEFAASTPFLYFCDFAGDLARALREGRRREFAAFPRFADPAARERIPDPNDERTFRASKLDWDCLAQAAHEERLANLTELLAIRAAEIAPRLAEPAHGIAFNARGLIVSVDWELGDGSLLHMRANFGAKPDLEPVLAPGTTLYAVGNLGAAKGLPAWGGLWTLEAA